MPDGGRIIMLNDHCRARGGATSIALLATRLLRARGHEVIFVTGDDGKNPALEEIGVPTVPLGSEALLKAPKLTAMRKGIWNREGAAFLRDWIAREGRADDVWHLHNWSQIWSPSVFSGLDAVHARLAVHAHDYFNACPNGAFWHYPSSEPCQLKPLSLACMRASCDKRSRVQKLWRVGRTAMLGRTFRRKDAPELLLIHPGMAAPFAHSGMQPARMTLVRNPVTPWLSERIRAEENRTLLYVGRLDSEKGGLALARAAARANVPVTFIGEGPEAQAITQACPHAVMAGWQNHEGIRQFARDARALIMPSVYPEPFGLVAVEALGSGLPVAVSHTALLAPEIIAAKAGWAVDIRDESGFATTLQQISAASSDEILALSEAAFATGPSLGIPPDQWADQLEAIYHRLRPNGADLHLDQGMAL